MTLAPVPPQVSTVTKDGVAEAAEAIDDEKCGAPKARRHKEHPARASANIDLFNLASLKNPCHEGEKIKG